MKNKYLLLMLAIFIVGFLFFYTSAQMINDNLDRIRRIDRRIRISQEQLNSAKVLNDELSEVSRVIENSLTEQRELSTSEANNFVRELADLADQYQIAVHSLFPRVSFAQGRTLEQQFSMELEATYVQLGQFLASIERYDYLLKVNTLEVRPTDRTRLTGDRRSTLYRVTVDLSIFKIVKEA
jgi:Tfp pilus assembly protein PilO